MLIIRAFVNPVGVTVNVAAECSGWRHPQRLRCRPRGASATYDTEQVERLGMDDSLLGALGLALVENDGLAERMWC